MNVKEIDKTFQDLFDNGSFDPESIVDHACNVDSPLHSLLDWDDKQAAHRWRIMQARRLMMSARVRIKASEIMWKPKDYFGISEVKNDN